MELPDVEKVLWNNLLNRLELERNAVNSDEISFYLDKGNHEGVDLIEFQRKALTRLVGEGAILQKQGHYNDSDPAIFIKKTMGQPLPLPDAYKITFGRGFKDVITRLREALNAGGINSVIVFEMRLLNRDIVVWDYEQECQWKVRKMNMDSAVHLLFEWMFGEKVFDLNREDVPEQVVTAKKSFAELVNDMKLGNNVRKVFFDVSRDRLVLRRIVTKEDLAALELTSEHVRSQLKSSTSDDS